MTTEQKEVIEEVIEESDKETIKKVYEKYIEEYNRKPHEPDIFTRFAKKFHDVHISFASAKSFLNDMTHKTSKTKTGGFLAPSLGKLKLSSISTPNVLTASNITKKQKLKTHLNEKYEHINDLELLKQIRRVIMNLDCIKNSPEIKAELGAQVFNNKDSQYFELMKRLSSSKFNDIGIRKLYMQPSISKDENFLSLKHLSERGDVDDVDHDTATYLLKNYYDTGPSSSNYDTDDNDDISIYDRMVLKYRTLSTRSSILSQQTVEEFKMKRLSLTLNDSLKPNFLMSSEPPLMDKAFRALSTDVSLTADTSIVTDISDQDAYDNTPIPESFINIMSKYDKEMNNWDFDIFSFMDDPVFCGKGLVYLSFYLFRKVGLLDSTGVSQMHLWKFFEQVDAGYIDANPYHNKYHGIDVLLNTHFFFMESEFMRSHMTQWDMFGAYIAAVCHDLGHMGFNNNWYISTAGNLALLYGNESVLENYHLNETFRILNKPSSNWMVSFTSSIRKYLSIVIKHSILATDVKHHGIKVHQLTNMIEVFKKENDENFNLIKLQKCQSIVNYANIESIQKDGFKLFINDKSEEKFAGDLIINDINMQNENEQKDDQKEEFRIIQPRIEGVLDERLFILGVTIHTCDVANPTKPQNIMLKWAHNYLSEVFNQGDTERSLGVPVSPGMDRDTTKLPNSQIGFITYVVKKLFILYDQLINSNGTKQCLQLLNENEKYWIKQKKEASNYKIARKPGLGTIDENNNKSKKKTVTFSDED